MVNQPPSILTPACFLDILSELLATEFGGIEPMWYVANMVLSKPMDSTSNTHATGPTSEHNLEFTIQTHSNKRKRMTQSKQSHRSAVTPTFTNAPVTFWLLQSWMATYWYASHSWHLSSHSVSSCHLPWSNQYSPWVYHSSGGARGNWGSYRIRWRKWRDPDKYRQHQ
jgi:hypothetical protein